MVLEAPGHPNAVLGISRATNRQYSGTTVGARGRRSPPGSVLSITGFCDFHLQLIFRHRSVIRKKWRSQKKLQISLRGHSLAAGLKRGLLVSTVAAAGKHSDCVSESGEAPLPPEPSRPPFLLLLHFAVEQP